MSKGPCTLLAFEIFARISAFATAWDPASRCATRELRPGTAVPQTAATAFRRPPRLAPRSHRKPAARSAAGGRPGGRRSSQSACVPLCAGQPHAQYRSRLPAHPPSSTGKRPRLQKKGTLLTWCAHRAGSGSLVRRTQTPARDLRRSPSRRTSRRTIRKRTCEIDSFRTISCPYYD